MPQKLHPLWYTPLLPFLFFITAVGVGLGMIIFESSLSSRALQRGLEIHLLSQLARAIPFVLGFYLLIRFGDLAVEGKLDLLFTIGVYSLLFWLEITVGAIIPIVLFSQRSGREDPKGLLIGSLFVIAELMLNRFDVSLLALNHLGGQSYSPNLMEFAISFGIISAGVLTFGLVAKYFPLFESDEHVAEQAAEPMPEPAAPVTARGEAAQALPIHEFLPDRRAE